MPQSVTVNGRVYRWPQRPLVVVCLDGSSVDYIRAANHRGATPYLGSLMSRGNIRPAQAAMPTFTNPNKCQLLLALRRPFTELAATFISTNEPARQS